MDEEALNMSIRKFLKKVGITSQREIERAVQARRMREIDRIELRNLTREALTDIAGEQAAERYLIWRHQQESDRPLLLLFGGAAGVGKTSLALEVAHRLGIGRVLSTDSIRQIMRITLSQDLVPALHASSFIGTPRRSR